MDLKQKLPPVSVWGAYQRDCWASPPEFLNHSVRALGLRIRTSNESPGDANSAGPGTLLWEPGLQTTLRALPFHSDLVFLQEACYFNIQLYVYVLPFLLFCWNLNWVCKFLWAEITPSTLHILSFSFLQNNEYISSVINNRKRKVGGTQSTNPNKQHPQMDTSPEIHLKINYESKNILPSVAMWERRLCSWWHVL